MPRDIDQIISAVREQFSDVEVVQWNKTHPTDDDGIWFFGRKDLTGEIELESTSGNCPFLVESDAMTRTDQAMKADTVEDAVKYVAEYLTTLR